MNEHTSVGIAQIVFYVPATIYIHYIGIRCWKYGPKMAWYPLMAFALVRLAGGGLVIAFEDDLQKNRTTGNVNISLIKATYVLLNIGLVPLLTAFNRLSAMVSTSNFPEDDRLKKIQKICGILVLVAAGLLGAAGGMTGKPGEADSQVKLSKIAYFEFLAVFVLLTLMCAYLYFVKRRHIREDHLPYLRCMLLAAPPMAVRTAYGVIGVFEATGDNLTKSMWSSLFGNATAFALMALLPEYIVLVIFMYLGRYRIKTCSRRNWVDDRPPKKSLKDKLKDNLQGMSLGQVGPGGDRSSGDSVEDAERGQNGSGRGMLGGGGGGRGGFGGLGRGGLGGLGRGGGGLGRGGFGGGLGRGGLGGRLGRR
ncbi:hypothetical protein B0T16DRAFT_457464 [Cercophora newfieldiana]|uniref:DUF7702 domain-containing protein n=1 Tax=Cercophora newfieldiana TaxID=92897 RepID=A0AA39Y4U0_9PEZI|nr:hypothetical protein B0T16DRAFT_457464 [Cercophora newfieldiana]